MEETKVAAVLRKRGDALLGEPFRLVAFTGDPNADSLLNDLQGYPHAFVLACLMDRQCPAEVAWAVPFRFKQRLKTFQFAALAALSLAQVQAYFVQEPPLHRYKCRMAQVFYRGVQKIAIDYAGDASRIWRDIPTSATVVARFREFHGAGPKIATMAANILVRDFKVSLRDYCDVDISPDVHVCRVFERLALVPKGAFNDQIISAARRLNPAYPGVFDLAAWEIGSLWCHPKQPECDKCDMQAVCAHVEARAGTVLRRMAE